MGDRRASLLVYGGSGTGKTLDLATLPPEMTWVADIEKGMETVWSRGIPTPAEPIMTIDQLRSAHNAILNRGQRDALIDDQRVKVDFKAIRFICVDGLTDLEGLFLGERVSCRKKSFATLQEQGEVSQLMRHWIRLFKELTTRGYHVIFTALEMLLDIEQNEKEKKTYIAPAVQQKAATKVPGYFSMVGRQVIRPKSNEREILFESDGTFVAKRRFPFIEPVEPPDLASIFRRVEQWKPNFPARSQPPEVNRLPDASGIEAQAKALGLNDQDIANLMKEHAGNPKALKAVLDGLARKTAKAPGNGRR